MEDLKLNRYEQMIAMDVIAPDDIPVTFSGKRPNAAVRPISFDIARYWRAREHRGGVEGICHLSSHNAGDLFAFFGSSDSSLRSPVVWPTRMWQNHAGKSISS